MPGEKPPPSSDGDDGSGIRPLNLPFAANSPAWRPDGKSLIVRAQRDGRAELYPISVPDLVLGDAIIQSDTTTALYATDHGDSEFQEANYSPDGSMISYFSGIVKADGSVGPFGGPDTRNFVMNADGTNVRMVESLPASDYEDSASFSPDGKQLLMTVRKGGDHQAGIDHARRVQAAGRYPATGGFQRHASDVVAGRHKGAQRPHRRWRERAHRPGHGCHDPAAVACQLAGLATPEVVT